MNPDLLARTDWSLRAYPALLGVLAASIAVLAWRAARDRTGAGAPLASRRAWAAAWLLAAAAWALRAFAVRRTHRVFIDEFEHLNIASNLARLGAFAESLASGPELDVLSPSTWPGGFHLPLAAAFRLFGDSEETAFAFNAALGALAVPAVFLAGLALWRDRAAALCAAALWAVHPLPARYAASTDLTTASALSVAAAWACLGAARERPSARWLALAACGWAAHTRFENALLLPLLWGLAGRPAGRRRAAAEALAAGLIVLPLAWLAGRNRAASIPGFSDGLAAHLGHLARNLPSNVGSLLAKPELGTVVLPALFAGLPAARAGGRRQALCLLACAAGYVLVYSAFFRGDFGLGSEDRYAAAPLLAFSLLAGLGLAAWLREGRLKRAAAAFCLGLALAVFWPAREELDVEHQQEYRLLKQAEAWLPPETYVVAFPVPAVMVAARRPAVSPYLLIEAGGAPAFLGSERAERLVLLRDWWWERRPQDSRRAEALLERDYAPAGPAVRSPRPTGYLLEPLRRREPPGR